jgi:hypothetical protein
MAGTSNWSDASWTKSGFKRRSALRSYEVAERVAERASATSYPSNRFAHRRSADVGDGMPADRASLTQTVQAAYPGAQIGVPRCGALLARSVCGEEQMT